MVTKLNMHQINLHLKVDLYVVKILGIIVMVIMDISNQIERAGYKHSKKIEL